jgi:hypothetical protein
MRNRPTLSNSVIMRTSSEVTSREHGVTGGDTEKTPVRQVLGWLLDWVVALKRTRAGAVGRSPSDPIGSRRIRAAVSHDLSVESAEVTALSAVRRTRREPRDSPGSRFGRRKLPMPAPMREQRGRAAIGAVDPGSDPACSDRAGVGGRPSPSGEPSRWVGRRSGSCAGTPARSACGG